MSNPKNHSPTHHGEDRHTSAEAKSDESSFEKWDPSRFGRGADYQIAIRDCTAKYVDGDILDVGCGSRVFYDLTRAKSWTGIDISERMLSETEFIDEIDLKKFMVGDVLELPFPDGSFDTVTCLFLLHHLGQKNRSQSEKRVQLAFNEMRRVLKPGGRLIIGENCRGPLEEIYHSAFPVIYAAARRLFGVEMPFFWRSDHYEDFARGNKLTELAQFRIPIKEWIYQPIFGLSVPPFLSNDLIQKMTVFVLERPKIE